MYISEMYYTNIKSLKRKLLERLKKGGSRV